MEVVRGAAGAAQGGAGRAGRGRPAGQASVVGAGPKSNNNNNHITKTTVNNIMVLFL